jgi:hypothetical protein
MGTHYLLLLLFNKKIKWLIYILNDKMIVLYIYMFYVNIEICLIYLKISHNTV